MYRLMTSLKSQILELYDENSEISIEDLKGKFPEENVSSLSGRLSEARNPKPKDSEDVKIFVKLTEKIIEEVIVDKLNRKAKAVPDSSVRLAIDFLKNIKKSDELEEKLDMEALRQIGVNVAGGE